ncbi:hypothetical protein E2C01_052746 [Portunus trituberculatus]|uniref:Uncharacterized protein n=1 Tax=Portunus trituberculatus TaxID=210409 RepID=A0A5B7GNC0_PORTR|nr:hypothetical protein [Portunus trituberculatus]
MNHLKSREPTPIDMAMTITQQHDNQQNAHPHQALNDDLLIIDQGEEENIYSTGRSKAPPQRSSQNGLPRSASLPLNNGSQKRAPPPRPPPPKKNPSHVSIVLD